MSDDKLSTSALARQLELPVQQLFSALKDHNWIKKVDDGWALTGKGKFEGGRYQSSKRYGRYIVWPAELLEHPLLRNLEKGRLISAAALGKPHRLSAQQVNRLLAVLAWLRPAKTGWQLTQTGKKLGGQVFENQQLGVEYVLWPEDIGEQRPLQRLFEQVSAPLAGDATEGDLFHSSAPPATLDGRQLRSWPHWQIAQWLYLAGLRYACEVMLPVAESLRADFYLPDQGVYLEFWGGDEQADQLARRMRRQEAYKALGTPVVDVHPDDLPHLDDYLSRRLRELAVDFH